LIFAAPERTYGPAYASRFVFWAATAACSGKEEHAWMNSGKYVARRILDENARTLTVRVYDVSSVAIPTGAANATRMA
jgi:hypothetical protein